MGLQRFSPDDDQPKGEDMVEHIKAVKTEAEELVQEDREGKGQPPATIVKAAGCVLIQEPQKEIETWDGEAENVYQTLHQYDYLVLHDYAIFTFASFLTLIRGGRNGDNRPPLRGKIFIVLIQEEDKEDIVHAYMADIFISRMLRWKANRAIL